jgi:hypothetical protein
LFSSVPEEQLAATYKTWMNPELEFVEQGMLYQCLPEDENTS